MSGNHVYIIFTKITIATMNFDLVKPNSIGVFVLMKSN